MKKQSPVISTKYYVFLKLKYTKHLLNKLEDLFSETDYILRYEKGNFESGYCILENKKVIVVNKYYPLEGKIDILIKILNEKEISSQQLSSKNFTLYSRLTAHLTPQQHDEN